MTYYSVVGAAGQRNFGSVPKLDEDCITYATFQCPHQHMKKPVQPVYSVEPDPKVTTLIFII